MNIGDVATRAGLPTKTIRYYEDIGLIQAVRDANGYRTFSDADVHKLTFVARARTLGFSINDCRALLALWEDRARASADVRQIASGHLSKIEEKIADLEAMRDSLRHLVSSCAGDDRPDCPILKSLAQD